MDFEESTVGPSLSRVLSRKIFSRAKSKKHVTANDAKPAVPGLRLSKVENTIQETGKIETARRSILPSEANHHGLLINVLHKVGLTKEQQAETRAKKECNELERFDRDGDGNFDEEEMASIMKKYVSIMHTRNMLRRGLACAACFLFVAVIIITVMTVATAVSLKSTTVDEDSAVGMSLTQFRFGDSNHIVSTGSAEDVFEVAASRAAFDQLDELDLFAQRPRLVVVEFSDGSVTQFPPENIQSFPHSATLSNAAVGVALVIAKDELPQVQYVGGVDGLAFVEPEVPEGPYSAIRIAERAAPRVSRLRMYQFRGQNITKLADRSGEGGASPAGDGAAPVDKATVRKTKQQKLTEQLKSGLAPLHDTCSAALSNVEGRIAQGRADHWRFILEEPVNLDLTWSFCRTLEAGEDVEGSCSASGKSLAAIWSNVSSRLSTGVLDVYMSYEQLQKLREHMKTANTSFGIKTMNKALVTSSDALSPASEPDPIHAEMRRSARALLASTPAGMGMAKRAAIRLHREQERVLGPDEHRRRLWGWYQRKVGHPVPDKTCYRADKPGFFAGSVVDTCGSSQRLAGPYTPCVEKGEECVDWDEVLNNQACRLASPPVTRESTPVKKLECICKMVGGEPRHWTERTGVKLERNFARAHCVNLGDAFKHLEDKPMCFYRKSWARSDAEAIAKGRALIAAAAMVMPCFAEYYEKARTIFSCLSCSDETPFDYGWPWMLSAVISPKGTLMYDGQDDAYSFNELVFSGEHVHLFVIDSGVNHRHDAFLQVENRNPQRIGRGVNAIDPNNLRKCFPPNRMGPCDDTNGHGTHVAGVAAGNLYGIARKAIVHPIRIGKDQRGTISSDAVNFIVAEMWKVQQRDPDAYGIAIFSQGTTGGTYSQDVERLLDYLLENKISVVASAGNAAADACLASPNRMVGRRPIVVVGATNVDDSQAYYSNYGSCISVHAPGTGIYGPDKWRTGGSTGYVTYRGTSQACPVVAGIMALAAEAMIEEKQHGNGQAPTPGSLLRWLKETAEANKVQGLEPNANIPDEYYEKIKRNFDPKHREFWNAMNKPRGVPVRKFRGKNYFAKIPQIYQKKRTARQLAVRRAHRFPRELADATDAAENEVGVCDHTVLEYEGACPPRERVICGSADGVAPDGTQLLRPYRKAVIACSAGCSCNASALGAVSYHSCAADACDYAYTGEPCNVVFNVTTPAEARDLSGVQLLFEPLPDGTGFYEPVVTRNRKIEAGLADTAAGTFTRGMRRFEYDEPTSLSMCEQDVFKVSMGSNFPFLGDEFDTIDIAANGYVGFSHGEPPEIVSEATAASHFSASKGRSFSLMLADLSPTAVYVAHVDEQLDETTTEPYATAVTFLNAPLAYDETAVPCTVQGLFVHETGAVTLTFGGVSESLDAYIGPSDGTAAIVSRLSQLLGGSLPSASASLSSSCDDSDDGDDGDDGNEQGADGDEIEGGEDGSGES